jgi:hypothetical protein
VGQTVHYKPGGKQLWCFFAGKNRRGVIESIVRKEMHLNHKGKKCGNRADRQKGATALVGLEHEP